MSPRTSGGSRRCATSRNRFAPKASMWATSGWTTRATRGLLPANWGGRSRALGRTGSSCRSRTTGQVSVSHSLPTHLLAALAEKFLFWNGMRSSYPLGFVRLPAGSCSAAPGLLSGPYLPAECCLLVDRRFAYLAWDVTRSKGIFRCDGFRVNIGKQDNRRYKADL